MSKVVSGLRYSAEHEWINAETPAVVGVSQTAADALGDVVYIDLPEVGAQLTAGEVCGEIESTKSVSELFAPVSGEVVEVNDDVVNDPSVVNEDAFAAWLFKVAVTEEGPLLSAEEYAAANDGDVE